MKKSDITLSFEEAIKRLTEISKELEGEQKELDTSLALYEEGVKLIRHCNTLLESAQRKIKILSMNSDGELEEKSFDAQADAE